MHPRYLLTAALVVGALAPVTGAALASAAQNAGLGIRLLDAPTDRRDDPRARTYIIDHLAPGTTIKRRVQLSDNTGAPLQVSLYVGGAAVQGGSFVPSTKGTPSELATWSMVSPTAVSLKAGNTANALVTITVPGSASPGERYGVIWAELPPSGGAVKSVNRVGVRIYLSVGTGREPRSDFSVDSLQAVRRGDGRPAVLARIRNTGARALDMRGTLQLSNGPGGLSAGPFPAQVGTTLAPGDSAPVVVPLDKAIRGGPWHAVVDMKSGLLERKAEGDVTFPDQADAVSPVVKAKALPLYKDRGLVGTFAAVLIGLLLLALLLWWLLARRRRREDDEVASST